MDLSFRPVYVPFMLCNEKRAKPFLYGSFRLVLRSPPSSFMERRHERPGILGECMHKKKKEGEGVFLSFLFIGTSFYACARQFYLMLWHNRK